MSKFTKMLPALLARTDVVLEIRDSRLPLTSINENLEGMCHWLVPAFAFCVFFCFVLAFVFTSLSGPFFWCYC